jgi:hypothetical protein
VGLVLARVNVDRRAETGLGEAQAQRVGIARLLAAHLEQHPAVEQLAAVGGCHV